ncbi:CBD9-like protein [Marasmius fiardii PR-910]|nr:CBD9-like protein [Marasmius fiardii PR-910]
MLVSVLTWAVALAFTQIGRVAGSALKETRQLTAQAATGDSSCSSFMCISATLKGSEVEYVLSSEQGTPGYMAMGFGQSMQNSPMVIMWANKDGSVTLSQRQSSSYAPPQVVANPPRAASLSTNGSSVTGSDIKYAFTVPHDGQTTQTLIWAFSSTNPGSSDPSASIVKHTGQGVTALDLSKTLTAGSNSTSGANTSAAPNIPFVPYQKIIVAHAFICGAAFLFFLPGGAMSARLLRTFSNSWFKLHWIHQWVLAGITIVVGVILGIASVAEAQATHLDSTHKIWGIVIFILYLLQCSLGGIVHFFKPANPWPKSRPIQNYFHAVFGLLIIGLGFWQVRTGYKYEWPVATGRGDLPAMVDTMWLGSVISFPVIYGGGLYFLRKQYRQEKEKKESKVKADSIY